MIKPVINGSFHADTLGYIANLVRHHGNSKGTSLPPEVNLSLYLGLMVVNNC